MRAFECFGPTGGATASGSPEVATVLHHRAAAVLVLAAAGTLAFVLVTSNGHAPSPGATFSWASPSSTPSSGGVDPAKLPVASATPVAGAGTVGGLQLPFSAMLQQLNSETHDTAVGQYSILHDIGNAIRDQLVRFLTWISRAH
ncbi:MAG: hypothetical protein ABR498_04510 [Candidatus Dormibacteria bacterium]